MYHDYGSQISQQEICPSLCYVTSLISCICKIPVTVNASSCGHFAITCLINIGLQHTHANGVGLFRLKVDHKTTEFINEFNTNLSGKKNRNFITKHWCLLRSWAYEQHCRRHCRYGWARSKPSVLLIRTVSHTGFPCSCLGDLHLVVWSAFPRRITIAIMKSLHADVFHYVLAREFLFHARLWLIVSDLECGVESDPGFVSAMGPTSAPATALAWRHESGWKPAYVSE